MAHHHVTSADIAIHGDHLDPSKVSKVKSIAMGVAVLGTVVSLYLLFFAPEKIRGCFAYSWLFAFYFFLTLVDRRVFLDAAPQRLELGLGHFRAPDL